MEGFHTSRIKVEFFGNLANHRQKTLLEGTYKLVESKQNLSKPPFGRLLSSSRVLSFGAAVTLIRHFDLESFHHDLTVCAFPFLYLHAFSTGISEPCPRHLTKIGLEKSLLLI